MDYGVSRAEQWRRRRAAAAASIIQRASNGEEEETASLTPSLPPSRSRKSMLPSPTGRERSHLLPLPASDREEGRGGYFCKVPLR